MAHDAPTLRLLEAPNLHEVHDHGDHLHHDECEHTDHAYLSDDVQHESHVDVAPSQRLAHADEHALVGHPHRGRVARALDNISERVLRQPVGVVILRNVHGHHLLEFVTQK